MKDTSVRVRVDSHLKKEVVKILGHLGLNVSEVVNLLFAQIKLQKKIPFHLNLPNKKTLQAMKDADKRKTFKVTHIRDLMDDL